MKEFSHIPVMLEECLEGLNLKKGGIYFDGTVGGGGHSFEILKRTSPSGRLIATDLDEEAIEAATKRLSPFDGRFQIFHSNYKCFANVFGEAGIDEIDGAILDFGVSSHQIDDEERGFSYKMADAPLDMRMDRTAGLTAKTVLNTYSEQKLAYILKEYGEESFARKIAKNIIERRAKQPFETSGELAKVIQESIPAKIRFQGGPCERKTFQALRVEVNGELDGLYDLVIALTRRLKKGGRIVILTFQSLEDRAVKEAFRMLENPCTCPKNLPCVCGKKPEIKIITHKPITASEEELNRNSRAKCAKLRIAEKI